jgi:hypothetical protein
MKDLTGGYNLKNIKINEKVSEETLCFSAKLYYNNKYIADVSNTGHGGQNNYWSRDFEAIRAFQAYAHSLPPVVTPQYGELKMTADLLIDQMISDVQLRRSCKRRTVFRLPNGNTLEIREPYSAEVKAFIKAKYPDAEIINERFQ